MTIEPQPTFRFPTEGVPEALHRGESELPFVEFEPGGTRVVPGLAEKWDISEDGLVYTFYLRRNAKWQSNKNFKPSRDFNIDDVMFSFERQWKDANPYHKVSGGGYDYFNDMSFNKLLASIDMIDADTVRFTLNAPQAPFLSDLAGASSATLAFRRAIV